MKMDKRILVVFLASLIPSLIEGAGFELQYLNDGGDMARAGSADDWCYDRTECDQDSDKSAWKSGECKGGNRQSPIDIPGTGLKVDMKRCPVDLGLTPPTAYDFDEYELQNLGKTIFIGPKKGEKWSEAKFRFPGQNHGIYTLQQLHFHWGPDSNSGSEHEVDGKAFAMEMHLVHMRTEGPDSFKDGPAALSSKQGNAFAVLGFLLNVDDAAAGESFLEPLVKSGGALDLVPEPQNMTHTTGFPIKISALLKKQTHVYYYEGSLTTPACNEVVQWLVCKDPVPIKSSDVQRFRDISQQKTTFRKTQKLNDRKVTLLEIVH